LRPALIASLSLLAAAAHAQSCPSRPFWPTADWVDASMMNAQSHASEVAALEQFAFTLVGDDADRIGTRTDAVLIVKDGAIVYERYARGYSGAIHHYCWSMTKSVTNALTGIAVRRGALQLTDSVCDYATLPRTDHCDLHVQDLLEFASGLAWNEGYENGSNQDSSVLAMLYGVGRADMMSFVAGHDSRDPPGTSYEYSSGDATFLAGIVERAMRQSGADADWPWTDLLEPIGMAGTSIEYDNAGTPVGSSWMYATARDLAKFGFLFLNDGCWAGTRILPEGWVADSTAVSEPFKRKPLDTSPGDVQGRMWWLNRAVPEQNVPQPWPDVPPDAYAAEGHWGQSITVIPSEDTIIVRLADDRDGTFDFGRFLALALQVAR
jgi:CubicO group peptidase (beta-lactamase class C family)